MEAEYVRAGAPIPIWFSVPQAFNQMQLNADPVIRARRTAEQLLVAIPHTSGEQRIHFLLAQQYLIDQFIDNNIVYAATLLAKGDREDDYARRLTMAMFTLRVQELDVPAPHALHELSEKLRNPTLLRDVGWLGLPAGQALVVVEDRQGAPETTVFGDPTTTDRYFRQLQLTIPFPDRRRVATFSICTENLADWQDYTDIFGSIIRTITFSRPRNASPDGPKKASLTGELDAATSFHS